jgi:hypothetical protein
LSFFLFFKNNSTTNRKCRQLTEHQRDWTGLFDRWE